MPVREAAAWGTRRFLVTVREVWALRDIRRFLISYFFYIDGILTVIVMAGVIATETTVETAVMETEAGTSASDR